jgi:hypothetical protein
LYCNGTLGAAYATRTINDPWVIWHIEAAYNTILDRWQIFWDEYNPYSSPDGYADMRTKYIWWDGTAVNSTLVCPCAGGSCTPPGCSDDSVSPDPVVLEVGEGEFYEYPPDYGVSPGSPGDGVLADAEGCRGLLVSFDSGIYNNSHRFLVSYYGAFWFVSENGVLCEIHGGTDFSIPVTGVSNVGMCSYQEVGICTEDGSWDQRLSHRRFTDLFASCQGGDSATCDHSPPPGGDPAYQEYPVTPMGCDSEPVAMGVNAEVAVVVYTEDTGTCGNRWGDLFITVIDN